MVIVANCAFNPSDAARISPIHAATWLSVVICRRDRLRNRSLLTLQGFNYADPKREARLVCRVQGRHSATTARRENAIRMLQMQRCAVPLPASVSADRRGNRLCRHTGGRKTPHPDCSPWADQYHSHHELSTDCRHVCYLPRHSSVQPVDLCFDPPGLPVMSGDVRGCQRLSLFARPRTIRSDISSIWTATLPGISSM
jgi:hypothetical protein